MCMLKIDRIQWIDNLKALTMLLVILGHCKLLVHIPYLMSAIYSFHMPLFFMISGFFIRPNYFFGGGKLMLHYFVTSIIISSYMLLCGESDMYQELLRVLFASGSKAGDSLFHDVPTVAAIWFLPALVWGKMLYSIIFKRNIHYLSKYLCVFILFAFGYWLIEQIRLPFSFLTGCTVVLFLCIGNVIRKRDYLKEIDLIIVVVAGLLCLFLSVSKIGFIISSVNSYGHMCLGLFTSVLVSFAVIRLAERYLNHKSKVLSFIGKNTLTLLCVHCFIDFFLYPDIDCANYSMFYIVPEFFGRLFVDLIVSFFIVKVKEELSLKKAMSKCTNFFDFKMQK